MNTTTFKTDVLNLLMDSLNDTKPWKGLHAGDWAGHVVPDEASDKLNHRFTRADFRNPGVMSSLSNFEMAIVILSWGGMRRDHAKRLFRNSEWIDVVGEMRKGQLSRAEAYTRFQNLKSAGKLNGMGPAYYTKLICFANPQLNGFIMDQWTAKSMNLLTDSDFIRLTYQGSVDDRNPAATYERFCKAVEDLSTHTNRNPLDTEEALFSYGGRRKGMWREFVVGNYSKRKAS
jgi:hypothetical protein